MKHLINWVEIPALDIDRAKQFYGQILGISFIDYPAGDSGMKYALFPSEDRYNAGALAQSPGHQPSQQGPTVYLDGGKDMDEILKLIPAAGGSIIMPKTYMGPDAGYVALFTDSEGNKMGLQHP